MLLDLWWRGHYGLAIAGLGIDLLPGPTTVAHFVRLGHPWRRCCLLIFHPLNFYLHSVVALCMGEDSNLVRNAKKWTLFFLQNVEICCPTRGCSLGKSPCTLEKPRDYWRHQCS